MTRIILTLAVILTLIFVIIGICSDICKSLIYVSIVVFIALVCVYFFQGRVLIKLMITNVYVKLATLEKTVT